MQPDAAEILDVAKTSCARLARFIIYIIKPESSRDIAAFYTANISVVRILAQKSHYFPAAIVRAGHQDRFIFCITRANSSYNVIVVCIRFFSSHARFNYRRDVVDYQIHLRRIRRLR